MENEKDLTAQQTDVSLSEATQPDSLETEETAVSPDLSLNKSDDSADSPVLTPDETDANSDAASEADEPEDEDEKKPRTGKDRIAYPLYDLASIVGTAVIAIMVVFSFFYRFVGVVGPSMQPTLFEDDWLAVSAIPKDPKAGDIVIITQPNAFDEPIVKRVVATGGQTIDIRDGHVFIDGVLLRETYISQDVVTNQEDLDNYPLTVPDGQVFVLGDNRMHSTDSRSAAVGLIDNDYVLGTVSFRIMPFGKWKVNIEYPYTD